MRSLGSHRLTIAVSMLICVSIGLGLITIIVRQYRPPTELGQFPLLGPDEQIANTGEGWYRPPGARPIFTFDGPFPQMPDKMLVYEVVPPPQDVSEEHIRELAQRHFDFPADAEFHPASLTASLITETRRLRYDQLTGFLMMATSTWANTSSRDPSDFPTAAEAVEIATDYLREHNLLPPDAVEGRANDTNIRGSGVMDVGWCRRIGGYRTWGPGGEISVQIGPGGEVVRVAKRWLDCRPWKMAPIIRPEEAFEMLNHGDQAFIASRGGKVRSIELMYHCRPEQSYIQPVYYFWIADNKGYAAVPAVRPEHIDRNPSPADPPRRHPTDSERTP